jgi:hypothetical protein
VNGIGAGTVLDPSARESMIQAIWSSVPKVSAFQTKLNVMPSLIRICGRPNCTFELIDDYRRFNRNRHSAKVHGKMREGRKGGGLSRKAILSEIHKSLKRQVRREHLRCCVQGIGKAR